MGGSIYKRAKHTYRNIAERHDQFGKALVGEHGKAVLKSISAMPQAMPKSNIFPKGGGKKTVTGKAC